MYETVLACVVVFSCTSVYIHWSGNAEFIYRKTISLVYTWRDYGVYTQR